MTFLTAWVKSDFVATMRFAGERVANLDYKQVLPQLKRW